MKGQELVLEGKRLEVATMERSMEVGNPVLLIQRSKKEQLNLSKKSSRDIKMKTISFSIMLGMKLETALSKIVSAHIARKNINLI